MPERLVISVPVVVVVVVVVVVLPVFVGLVVLVDVVPVLVDVVVVPPAAVGDDMPFIKLPPLEVLLSKYPAITAVKLQASTMTVVPPFKGSTKLVATSNPVSFSTQWTFLSPRYILVQLPTNTA